MLIKCQISDPIWWGYNIDLDLQDYHNIEGIIKHVLDNLEATLVSLNLLPQKEFLVKVKKDFHIHNLSFEDILLTKENDIVYICRHNNTGNDLIKLN